MKPTLRQHETKHTVYSDRCKTNGRLQHRNWQKNG